MSGPKVIDIAATREQERRRLAALCARLDQQLAWFREHAEAMPASVRRELPETLYELTEQLTTKAQQSQRFLEIQALSDQARSQLHFIRSERRRIAEQWREWKAHESANFAALDEMAQHLHEEVSGDETLEVLLQTACKAETIEERARLLEEITSRLSDREEEQRSIAERGRIHKLATEWRELITRGEFRTSLSELPVPPQARWRIECERLRLGLTEHPALLDELESLESETDPARRQMRLDDLRHRAAGIVTARRRREERQARVDELLEAARVSGVDLEALRIETHTREALESDDEEPFRSMIRSLEQSIEIAIQEASLETARAAILQALRQLGYEVREGMQTAWVEDGKVILRRPEEQTFGVEFSNLSAGTSVFKARVVRIGGPAAQTGDQKLRDKEQEASWCNDREAMEEILTEQGIDLKIKAMRKPGEVPVEAVGEASEDERRRAGSLDRVKGKQGS